MNRLFFILAWTAGLMPFAGAADAVAPTAAPAAADVGAPRPEYFQFAHMHQLFLDRGRAGPVGLLFLGDSITEAWWNVPELWWERYGAHQPANFGISGDRTQNVIWRFERGELDGIAPRVVVLLIGSNNTADNSAGEIEAGIRKILGLIRQKLPESRTLLLAIFPRGPRNNWDGRPDKWEQRMAVIREVNARLHRCDDGRHVRFLDLGHLFVDGLGNIPAELMPDQLHLSPAAYRLWADAMQPLLAEMLR